MDHFRFWNLEQPSTEKAGIQPTYRAPFQEVVCNLPAPHAPWHGAKVRVSALAGFLPHTHAKSERMAEASSRHRWQRHIFIFPSSIRASIPRRQPNPRVMGAV
jgi:hypothetical protein